RSLFRKRRGEGGVNGNPTPATVLGRAGRYRRAPAWGSPPAGAPVPDASELLRGLRAYQATSRQSVLRRSALAPSTHLPWCATCALRRFRLKASSAGKSGRSTFPISSPRRPESPVLRE